MMRVLKRLLAVLAVTVLVYDPSAAASDHSLEAVTLKPAAPPTADGGGEIKLTLFGKTARIRLSVGLLGFTVILILAILLSLALLFAWMARRRLRQTQVANRKLEIEIRERKRAREQIIQLNASLESRVAERTREVEEANQQLAAMNKELEAFSYSVSHDLRAPLRGIDGWSLALLEDYGSQLDERARTYLDRVRSETQRMGVLIDDLLQLSKVTRAEMQRSPVDLTSIGNAVATQLREAHPERQMEFTIATGLTAHGDAGLLQIVLTNLMSNAVKFTGNCLETRIQFGQSQRNGESAFFVQDNGVGFDMAFAGTLFGAFQRLHKVAEFPGTGIGLATVQRVIHRHGGRVWADAQIGQGATFFFTVRSAE
jgi:light-regulated signal transduction histidine kinase (bacteriophytochrome)